MARYPIQQPPNGYTVVFDAQMKRYYPLRATDKRGHASDGWDYIKARTPDGVEHHVSYAKRADAVRFCWRQVEGTANAQDA